jgi:type IV pilus assembly protein PilV
MDRPHGFSLVEVMVALIIICVGLLGIAKLQALMLSNTGASRTRALAALEASSIAASMHADRDYWTAAPATTTTVVTTNSSITSTDPVLATTPNCFAGQADAPCTSAAKMAAFDLNNWMTDMGHVLPGSTASIVCATNVGVVTCTIGITWQENTVASNTQESTAVFQNQSYQLVVTP